MTCKIIAVIIANRHSGVLNRPMIDIVSSVSPSTFFDSATKSSSSLSTSWMFRNRLSALSNVTKKEKKKKTVNIIFLKQLKIKYALI